MNQNELIQKAMESIREASKRALQCPFRPMFHFLPQAQWINDPNGTIYYKGEYHIFFQFNPYGERWGNMHWGHAKSKDLIHWKNLPIALAPEKNKGENHVYSGCCVLDKNQIPTIFYTSIKSLKHVWKGAEQWAATSEDNMITWKRVEDNPRLSDEIHDNLRVRNWRDPYIFKKKKDPNYYMVLGGNIAQWKFWKKRGSVFLYKSSNLKNWEFLGETYRAEKSVASIIECPNIIPLGDKYVLIISTIFDHKLKYCIGDFDNNKFIPNKKGWNYLDLGSDIYATNTLFDEHKRWVLFSWVKGGGSGGWNGVMALPRILELNESQDLIQKPIDSIQKIRTNKKEYLDLQLENGKYLELSNPGNNMLEILVRFEDKNLDKDHYEGKFGIRLSDQDKSYHIQLNYTKIGKYIICAGEKGKLNCLDGCNYVQAHIFIDKSIIEVFINERETITARFLPKVNEKNPLQISIYSVKNKIKLKKLEIWKLEI